jgi:hypothetical protein
MSAHALKFSEFLNRLKLIGVDVKRNPEFSPGRVWLFGKKGPSFPFTRGPVYTVKDRADDVVAPRLFILKILKHLGLEQPEQAQFWNIADYSGERSVRPNP